MHYSALLGQPPATPDDYWIARSLLLSAGLTNVDPSQGAKIRLSRPPPHQYRFETRAPSIIAGSAVSIVIMVVITVTRLLIRCFDGGVQFGADDWLIIPGVTLAVVWPCLNIAIAHYGGAGKHIYDVTYHEIYMFNWFASIGKLVFYVSVGIIKMSITMFNMRLTGLSSRNWMIAHWTFFALLVAYTLAAIFMNIFQCNPASVNFNSIAAGKMPTKLRCMSEYTLGTALSSMHVAMDFCLLAVPIILLWRVKLSWAKKLRLYCLFSIGAMSCIGSVFRQVTKMRMWADMTFSYSDFLAWALVDLTCGVLAASLPCVSVLLPRCWTKVSKARSRQEGRSVSGHRPLTMSYGSSPRPDDQWRQQGIMRQDEIELSYNALESGMRDYGHSSVGNSTGEILGHPPLMK